MNEQLQKILVTFNDTVETSLVDRFKAIIDYETTETRRWKELEEFTGIATHSWQKAYLGKQRPTAEMLEAVAQYWPKYAFWMMTGITDLDGQHVCPPNSNPWPSAPEDLEKASTNCAWRPLIEMKPQIRRFLSDEPIPRLEEEKLEKSMSQLELALSVSTTLRRLIIKKQLNDITGSRRTKAKK